MFDLEDMDGIVRCILWPEEFASYGHLVQADAILVVRGAVDRRPGSEEANLIVNELIPLDDLAGRFTKGVVDPRQRRAARAARPGSSCTKSSAATRALASCSWCLRLADGSKVYLKSDEPAGRTSARDAQPGRGLLGPGNFRLIAAPPKAGPPPRQRQGRSYARV